MMIIFMNWIWLKDAEIMRLKHLDMLNPKICLEFTVDIKNIRIYYY